ncbi:MAG: T9SS type A sorting domain-containing protein, partial [Candidatus Cloacimonadaceae bacterium]
VALLDQNWGSFGKVRILHPDLTYWKEYSVGMAPTDMKLWQTGTAVQDEVIPPLSVKVFPNPTSRHGGITFESDKLTAGKIRIYNLKGQLITSFAIQNNGAEIYIADLVSGQSSGCYFYRLTSGQVEKTGKFVIID